MLSTPPPKDAADAADDAPAAAAATDDAPAAAAAADDPPRESRRGRSSLEGLARSDRGRCRDRCGGARQGGAEGQVCNCSRHELPCACRASDDLIKHICTNAKCFRASGQQQESIHGQGGSTLVPH